MAISDGNSIWWLLFSRNLGWSVMETQSDDQKILMFHLIYLYQSKHCKTKFPIQFVKCLLTSFLLKWKRKRWKGVGGKANMEAQRWEAKRRKAKRRKSGGGRAEVEGWEQEVEGRNSGQNLLFARKLLYEKFVRGIYKRNLWEEFVRGICDRNLWQEFDENLAKLLLIQPTNHR